MWVVLACATAMAMGTAAGGVPIIKTMGTKIIDLKPIPRLRRRDGRGAHHPHVVVPRPAGLHDART